MPCLLYGKQRESSRILTYQQEQQQQQKPHLAASTGTIPFGKSISLTQISFRFPIPTPFTLYPAFCNHLPLLSGHLWDRTVRNREDKSRAGQGEISAGMPEKCMGNLCWLVQCLSLVSRTELWNPLLNLPSRSLPGQASHITYGH